MISAQVDQVQQDLLIEKYMYLPNQVWDEIISRASKNVDFLKNMAAVKQLGSILKTNVAACKALGHSYVLQLGRIYLDMLNVYKIMSEYIVQAITASGVNVNNQPLIKVMHVVRKETLTLISEWVSRSNDNQMVMDNFIPPLLDAVLMDYQVGFFAFISLKFLHKKKTKIPEMHHPIGTRTESTQHYGGNCE